MKCVRQQRPTQNRIQNEQIEQESQSKGNNKSLHRLPRRLENWDLGFYFDFYLKFRFFGQ